MKTQQSGFTLLELAVVLSVLSLLATLAVPNFMDQYNEKRAAVTIKETDLMMDAVRAYRANTGNWPGQPTCTTAVTVLRAGPSPYLGGTGYANRYNSPYVTSCNANSFTISQDIIPDYDGVVANGLPGTVVSNSATSSITSIVGVPGSEGAIAGKLSRISTGNIEDNRMRADLLLGGNNISEINNVSSNAVSTTNLNTHNASASGTVTASQMNANNAHIGGTVSTNQMNAQNAWVGGTVTSSALNTNVVNSGNINGSNVNAAGGIHAQGNISTNGIVHIGAVSWVGGWCTTGSIGRDNIGNILSCQNGSWTAPSRGLSCQSIATQGASAASASCPAGFTKVGWDSWGANGAWNAGYHVGHPGNTGYSTIFCCQ